MAAMPEQPSGRAAVQAMILEEQKAKEQQDGPHLEQPEVDPQ